MSCSCHDKTKFCSCGTESLHSEQNDEENENRKTEILKIILSAAFLLTSYFVKASVLRYLFLCVSYLAVGTEVVYGAVKSIIAGEFFDEETLMSIATIGAIAIGDYAEAVAVMLLYRIGELVQDIAVERSKMHIKAAVDRHPDRATVERNGIRIAVDPETVTIGETIFIGVGERIPLDSVIVSGSSRLDNSALTGESNSVRVEPGDPVYAGAINLVSELTAKTIASTKESATGRLMRAIGEASETKPALERFITRFSKVYTPCVVAFAVLLAAVPPAIGAGSFRDWVHRALSFLVISCPCALVLSIPLTFYAGLGMLSKKEFLPKSADVVERLAGVKAMAFDKTGTLTTGRFSVLSVHPDGISEQELLSCAAMVERTSPHPIAAAIIAASDSYVSADRTEEIVGKGVIGYTGQTIVAVGNIKLFEELRIPVPPETEDVLVGVDGRFIGSIEIGDTIRTEAKSTVDELEIMGIDSYMLTGDVEQTARNVSESLGIDDFFYGLLPEKKVEKLIEIRSSVGSVAFVGDGMNDSPVLRAADIGIAMADRNVELAAETADMLLLSGKLENIPAGIKIAKQTVYTAKLNVAIALGIKLLAMILSALGLVGMWAAVVADSGAALICVLVALTLFRTKVK